jgi:Alanine dehydrogenase
LLQADLVVGALYATGGRTPLLISRAMLSLMKPGAVIVDVSIDQGAVRRAAVPPPTRRRSMPLRASSITAWPHAGRLSQDIYAGLDNATLPYIVCWHMGGEQPFSVV